MNIMPNNDFQNENGQYMVEFALSFVIFVIFVLYVIDVSLLIYNHNLFYHGVEKAAREASIGASNKEIRNTAEEFIVSRYFPTAFLMASPDTGLTITPEREISRVRGTEVTVKMPTTFGFSVLGYGVVTLSVPVTSKSVITRRNDQDRDGCKDALEGPSTSCKGYKYFSSTQPKDHRNNGTTDRIYFDGPQNDEDGDGTVLRNDYVEIGYFESPPSTAGPVYAIHRPNNTPVTTDSSTTFVWNKKVWETWFDGRYHAPVLWDDGTESLSKPFARTLPKVHVDQSSETVTIRRLQAAYDSDNDGWEDKYDKAPGDPLKY